MSQSFICDSRKVHDELTSLRASRGAYPYPRVFGATPI